ncbi:Myb-like protein I [Porphyridium purpureum]|uniref:Myb-like protein I n=1 Tax=Porphyridium purpureum TaxID=35688 RepID=A0A5J4YUX0_PORPP|nr:Myb-like protein I [Porphyridium purpureum]|eukprot:POR0500..scf227_4
MQHANDGHILASQDGLRREGAGTAGMDKHGGGESSRPPARGSAQRRESLDRQDAQGGDAAPRDHVDTSESASAGPGHHRDTESTALQQRQRQQQQLELDNGVAAAHVESKQTSAQEPSAHDMPPPASRGTLHRSKAEPKHAPGGSHGTGALATHAAAASNRRPRPLVTAPDDEPPASPLLHGVVLPGSDTEVETEDESDEFGAAEEEQADAKLVRFSRSQPHTLLTPSTSSADRSKPSAPTENEKIVKLRASILDTVVLQQQKRITELEARLSRAQKQIARLRQAASNNASLGAVAGVSGAASDLNHSSRVQDASNMHRCGDGDGDGLLKTSLLSNARLSTSSASHSKVKTVSASDSDSQLWVGSEATKIPNAQHDVSLAPLHRPHAASPRRPGSAAGAATGVAATVGMAGPHGKTLSGGSATARKGSKSRGAGAAEGARVEGTTRYWSKAEHERFLQGVSQFGWKNYAAISTVVRTRNAQQVRTHAQKYEMRLERERKRTDSAAAGRDEGGADTSQSKRAKMLSNAVVGDVTKLPKQSALGFDSKRPADELVHQHPVEYGPLEETDAHPVSALAHSSLAPSRNESFDQLPMCFDEPIHAEQERIDLNCLHVQHDPDTSFFEKAS